MSRYLSQALGVNEPKFRQALSAQERRHGHPNHDIRLTARVAQEVNQKIKELGLDPNDTTSKELYFALNHKLATEDKLLNRKIRTLAASEVNAEANLADGVMVLVKSLDLNKLCFALKSSVLKKQLKASPPKKVMKVLGYRSVDSMLKLEPVALIMLAINDLESEAYLTSFYGKYKKYKAASFEVRPLKVLMPKQKRWQGLLKDVKKRTGLALVSSYELGSVIILPINNQPKVGYLSGLIATLLSECSIILSVSSYLKFYQVNSDFGSRLMEIAEHEPYLEARVFERPVSWRSAQHLISATADDLLAPHMSLDDLKPQSLLSKLADVLDEFKFWSDSQILSLVTSAEATSLNILDVALNVINELPYEGRRLDHCRHALGQELSKLYIKPEYLSAALNSEPSSENNRLVENQAQALY